MARLTGRLVGLDGVPAQQDNYRRSGFELAYRNVRYGGRRGRAGRSASSTREHSLRAAARFRRPVVPGAEAGFLAGWISLPESLALAAVEDGELRGFGVAGGAGTATRSARSTPRAARSRSGCSTVCAMALQVSRSSSMCRSPTRRRSPWPKGAISSRRSRRPGCNGPAPAIDLTQLYGVTTFELG